MRASDWEPVSWMIDGCDKFSIAEHLAFKRDTMLRCLYGADSHCNIRCIAMLFNFGFMQLITE